MKNQRYFSHPLLVVAALALASSMATAQQRQPDNKFQSEAQERNFQPISTGNVDSEGDRPQGFPLHEAFRYNICNILSSGSCTGFQPQAGMIWDNQTINPGSLYGTTTWGIGGNQYCPTPGFTGTLPQEIVPFNYSAGSVFMMNPQTQTYTTLFMFLNTSDAYGWNPVGKLVQDPFGNLWGTNCTGGYNLGAFFKLSPTPAQPPTWPWSIANTDYYDFSGNIYSNYDGATPTAGMYLDMDTNNVACAFGCLYGTTIDGGANNLAHKGAGTLYRIQLPQTNGGTWGYSKIYDFGASSSDAANPFASLIQEKVNLQNGYDILYGTTQYGGQYGSGAVWEFKIDESTGSGTESVLYNFCQVNSCSDGANPVSELLEDASGNLWGTTLFGGSSSAYGTVFELSPLVGTCPVGANTGNGWCETVIYTFAGGSDGAYPAAGLVADSNTAGKFLGTTASGGNSGCTSSFIGSGCGTVFQVGPSSYQQVFAFNPPYDGSTPLGGVVQDTWGDIWGTTRLGGSNNGGTIYELGCSGICAVLHVNPSMLRWGGIFVGKASSAQYVKVTNIGTQVVKFGSIEISGDFQLANVEKGGCAGALNPGASCSIGATFDPTQTGPRTGQITIMDSAQNSPQTVALSGTGVE